MQQVDEFLTINEASAIYKTKPYQLRYLINTNKLKAYKFGGRWLIKREDIERTLKPNF